MKRSLEQAWREISTDLDEVLDLDAGARQVWLETLQTRDPERAQRIRDYILDLEKLEKDNFLGQALPSILSVTPSLVGRRLGAYTVDRALRSLRARALSAVGRRDEAANEYASLLPELSVAFGTNTHQYAVDLFEYSVIEQRRGELRHAIELGNRAFGAGQTGGSAQRGLASVCLGLALSYLLARNAPAGLTWAQKARTLHEEIFGTTDPDGARFQAVAIFAGGLAGQPLEAVSQLEPIVEQQRITHSPYLARLLWFQGEMYLRAGQYREAAVHLQEAEQLAASHPDLGFQLPVIRADLGRALLGLGQLDAATVKLEAAISGAEVPHTQTPAQADAHAGLAQVLLKRNDPRAALVQASSADNFWRDFDPENPARQEAGELRSQASRAIAASAHRR